MPRPTLQTVVSKGDTRSALEALRDELAQALMCARTADPGKQGQVASLARQLRETVKDLAALVDESQESTVDDLARRRAARFADPEVQPRPKRKVVGGTGDGGTGSKRRAPARTSPAARSRRSTGGKT